MDLETRRVDVKVGEVVGVLETCQMERIAGVLKTLGGGGEKSPSEQHDTDSDSDSSHEADETSAPFHVQVTIALLRMWAVVPAPPSTSSLDAPRLVLDLVNTKLTLNDPTTSQSYRVGNTLIENVTSLKIGTMGLALAVPVTPSKEGQEYNLTPLTLIAQPHVSVQTTTPTSLAETVYYDTGGDHDAEEAHSDPDPSSDTDSDSDADFGQKSWLDMSSSMENFHRLATARGRKRESAIWKARNAGLVNSKTTLLFHLPTLHLSLPKPAFDTLQLLLNRFQLSQPAPPPPPSSPSEEEDTYGLDVSHLPLLMSAILRIDDLSMRLLGMEEESGGVEWLYGVQMSGGCVVVNLREGGDVEAHVEMDNLSVSNIDGQVLLTRSEVLKVPRPMLSLSLTSINDTLIQMRENTIAFTLSELRVMLVHPLWSHLGTHLTHYAIPPAGMGPVETVDAVTKLSVVMNGVVLDYRAVYRSFRVVVVLKRVKISLNLLPGSPTLGLTLHLQNSTLHYLKSTTHTPLTLDEPRLMLDRGVSVYLTSCKYAPIASCDVLEVSVRQTRGGDGVTRVEVEVERGVVGVDLCLDSGKGVAEVVEYLGRGGDGWYDERGPKPEKENVDLEVDDLSAVPDMDEILEAIDTSAFTTLPPYTRTIRPEYNESELPASDLLGGDDVISISDPQAVPQTSEIVVYHAGPYEIEEDYFSLTGTPAGLVEVEEDVAGLETTAPVFQFKAKDVNLIVRMFDGFDFPIRDFPDDDSDLQSSTSDPPTENSPTSSTTTHTLESRSTTARIHLSLSQLTLHASLFPTTCTTASTLRLSIGTVEVEDNVTTSMWRKFLTRGTVGVDEVPVETDAGMVVVEWVQVRPRVESPGEQEVRLKVAVSPLRFYVDQDALLFIANFAAYGQTHGASPSADASLEKGKKPDEPYFQLCSIRPIQVKIDYKPKHLSLLNLHNGNLLEIFNLLPLEGAEMTLTQIHLHSGVQGFEKLIHLIRNQWVQEVVQNQPHRVVKGLAGVKPVANVAAGVVDLVLLPWRQYRKEGKVMRGLEKGAKSFSKAAAMETLSLGTRIAITTQSLLEGIEKTTAGRPTATTATTSESHNKSKLSDQPRNIREGMHQGAQSLARNVSSAVQVVMSAPTQGVQNEGGSKRVAAVARAVPVAILRPMIGATEAVSKTLLGIQNTIDPEKKKQMQDKYKD
ncbi:autophagy- protein 2 [Podochytrium sp. JEL0797]|nr:autophagy- protein 2 [Podochytrium sp. JEL0797]